MKKYIVPIVLLAIMLVPALAMAKPPPDGAGGSPEPLSALLLAAGAAPAYLTYRWVRRKDSPEA